ncbi:MAG: hypothetical protein V3T83_10745, partial [Acidobacteriota bacterium]
MKKYIERQEEHHRKISFQKEYLELLKRSGAGFDEPFLWGSDGSGTLPEGVAKGLRGPKGRKGRKGQEALRRRFWQPEKSSGGYLASLTS